MFRQSAQRVVDFARKQGRKSYRSGVLYSVEHLLAAGKHGMRGKGSLAAHHIKAAGISAGKGVRAGINYGLKGTLAFTLPLAAFSAATADRGTMISSAVKAAPLPVLATLGGVFAGPFGAIAGTVLDTLVSEQIGEAVQGFIEYGQQAKALEMGRQNAQLVQTQGAYTMRQRAAQSLSTSLLNARHYLGKEAALLHS